MADARRSLTIALGWALTLACALAPALISSPAHGQFALRSPAWSELSPTERAVLAPLAPDWQNLDATRKQKWRGIAQRYPQLAPDEQLRV
ncbi:MAG: DUF3106 domain-containing protein, partial [Betaproteobacteria bacterium]|nr:DUF3106 domain-containing protein [Betaproteobacteria bacterium]